MFYLSLDELSGIRSQMLYVDGSTSQRIPGRVGEDLKSEGYSREMSDLWVRYARLAESVLNKNNPLRKKGKTP